MRSDLTIKSSGVSYIIQFISVPTSLDRAVSVIKDNHPDSLATDELFQKDAGTRTRLGKFLQLSYSQYQLFNQ